MNFSDECVEVKSYTEKLWPQPLPAFVCESRWSRQPHKVVPLGLSKAEGSHGPCFGFAVSLCAIPDVQLELFDLHGFLFSGPRGRVPRRSPAGTASGGA